MQFYALKTCIFDYWGREFEVKLVKNFACGAVRLYIYIISFAFEIIYIYNFSGMPAQLYIIFLEKKLYIYIIFSTNLGPATDGS